MKITISCRSATEQPYTISFDNYCLKMTNLHYFTVTLNTYD